MSPRPLPDDFDLRPYTLRDSAWIATAHSLHYREFEGFDASFDDAVAAALDDIHARLGRDRTFGLVLWDAGGTRRGSVFACDMGSTARLRLFLLESGLQGRGLGRAMLEAALARAGAAGARSVEVSTFDAHAAACGLYRRAGFAEVARTPCTAFGRRMAQVDFRRALAR